RRCRPPTVSVNSPPRPRSVSPAPSSPSPSAPTTTLTAPPKKTRTDPSAARAPHTASPRRPTERGTGVTHHGRLVQQGAADGQSDARHRAASSAQLQHGRREHRPGGQSPLPHRRGREPRGGDLHRL